MFPQKYNVEFYSDLENPTGLTISLSFSCCSTVTNQKPLFTSLTKTQTANPKF